MNTGTAQLQITVTFNDGSQQIATVPMPGKSTVTGICIKADETSVVDQGVSAGFPGATRSKKDGRILGMGSTH
jgi:hypothetical protein